MMLSIDDEIDEKLNNDTFAGLEISEFGKRNRIQIEPMFMNVDPALYICRIVSKEEFNFLLSFYENNQRYIMENLKETKRQRLINLESWFILIIEPRPVVYEDIEDWKKREYSKIKGKSPYQNPKLKKIKASEKVMDLVSQTIEWLKKFNWL